MSLIVRCQACKRNNRFKGRDSEISRGKSFTCSKCQAIIPLRKKANGKIVVLGK